MANRISELPNGKMYVQEDFKDYKTLFSNKDWYIFESIVSKGISEQKQAIEACVDYIIAKDKRCCSTDTVWRHIGKMITLNLFETEEIETGYRRFNILKLTLKGKMLYMYTFRKQPPRQEHENLASNHANYHHGYMIKDVKTILEQKKLYIHITTNRQDNILHLPNGRTCIPDVLAYYDEGKAHAFEVECGNHHQKDLEDKCNKLALLTTQIIFVGQNRRTVTNVLTKQIDGWIDHTGRLNLLNRKIKVYLTTLQDLEAGKWTYIYDMTSNKPICCFKE